MLGDHHSGPLAANFGSRAHQRGAGTLARELGRFGRRVSLDDEHELGPKREPADGFALVSVAVAGLGRRSAQASSLADPGTPALARLRAALGDKLGPPVIVALDHAGPAAAAWSTERAFGPADVESGFRARRPAPLDDDGWRAVQTAFVEGAKQLRGMGARRVAVHAADDGLLQATLSPRSNPDASVSERLHRLEEIFRGVAAEVPEVGLVLCVEERIPSGLDATGGLEAARVAIELGARFIVASSGSVREPERQRPRRGTGHPWIGSAAWLAGRTNDVPVWAAGPVGDEPQLAVERAQRAGLWGVVDDDRLVTS